MSNYVTVFSTPEAFVTKGKQRVKQFGGTVYLKDGDNFEIEIFNPTSNHILAKISLDGKLISYSGLILRPGERVFLERHIDSNNKFLYSTYEVNGNNEQVKNAIRSNGNLKVEFFNEQPILSTITYPSTVTVYPPIYHTTINNPFVWPYNPPTTVYCSTGTSGINGSSGQACTGSFTTTLDGSTSNGSTFTTSNFNSLSNPVLGNKTSIVAQSFDSNRKIETGTIEKGESSKQSFESVSRNFNTYKFHTVEWKILPKSQQPITSKDLKQYCTNCGKKIEKSTFRFCPNCGEKLE